MNHGAEKTIADYLRSWGLKLYIRSFLEHSIDLETLQMLSEADLRELVPIIGHRAKLNSQIKLLKGLMTNAFQNTSQENPNSYNLTVFAIDDLSIITTNPEDFPELPEINTTVEEEKLEYHCELYKILSSCNEGKGHLLQYHEKGLLDNAARRRLCNLIIYIYV